MKMTTTSLQVFSSIQTAALLQRLFPQSNIGGYLGLYLGVSLLQVFLILILILTPTLVLTLSQFLFLFLIVLL